MSNRLLPYGYRVHDGRLMIDGAEAIVVKEVCKMRASGMILSEIADKLNLRGIPFYETAGWDKHKVKRLLENDRYIGKDGYPPILSEDELLTARNYKYRAETEHVCPPTIQKLKNIMVCEECGAKLYRIFSKKSKKTPIVWQCWECGKGYRIKMKNSLMLYEKHIGCLNRSCRKANPTAPFIYLNHPKQGCWRTISADCSEAWIGITMKSGCSSCSGRHSDMRMLKTQNRIISNGCACFWMNITLIIMTMNSQLRS